MCKPASMIVLKDRVLWGHQSESHENIIAEHSIAMDGVSGPNGVRIELTPPNETDYETPPDQWLFKVDQDILPEWWDDADAERRCRIELVAWLAAKVVLPGQVRSVIKDGDHVVSVSGGIVQCVLGGIVQCVSGGIVQCVLGGIVQCVRGGIVQCVRGGIVQCVSGGIVQCVSGGIVQCVLGGIVQEIVRGVVRFFSSFSCKLSGPFTVVVDCTGRAAVCHVGTEEERVVTGGE